MNNYRNSNLDFIRKSKILRKEKEPTYYSGQIYYTYLKLAFITLNKNRSVCKQDFLTILLPILFLLF